MTESSHRQKLMFEHDQKNIHTLMLVGVNISVVFKILVLFIWSSWIGHVNIPHIQPINKSKKVFVIWEITVGLVLWPLGVSKKFFIARNNSTSNPWGKSV